MTSYAHSSRCTVGWLTGGDILRMAVMVLALRTDQHRFSQPTSSYRNRKPTVMCTTSVCWFNMQRQDEIFSLSNKALKSKGEMWHKIKKQKYLCKEILWLKVGWQEPWWKSWKRQTEALLFYIVTEWQVEFNCDVVQLTF